MNLLIVDDEVFAIQGLLDSINWDSLDFKNIFTASSYTQAINILMQNDINILLSDIEMPLGSGIDLVEWAKLHYPDIVCIFITSHGDFDYAKQAIKLQCTDFILKPVKPDILIDVLINSINMIKGNEENKKYQKYGEIYLNNIANEDQNSSKNINDYLEIIENYIQIHISECLTVKELANYVHLNADYLARIFKNKHQQTLIEYITEQRMLLSKELLLKSNMTISMISAKVGYPNYSYFIKLFKKYYDVTPNEFRQDKM